MELKKFYGDKIETHGINLEERWDLSLVRNFAKNNKMFPKEKLEKNLPKIHILDAGKKLPFKSGSYDIVFSQSTLQYIEDKAKTLEEVNRILKNDGIARIHIQGIKREITPKEYGILFEIWEKGKKIDYRNYLRRFENMNFKKSKDEPLGYLIMNKKKNLNLKLNLVASFDLHRLNSNFWGTKSIYVISK